MKDSLRSFLPIVLAGTFLIAGNSPASTTINATNHFAYGANIGWIDARGDVTDGAVIGLFYCFGYLYGANIGWVSLGDGTPPNGWRYDNNAANNW